jgi:hypothetical protein
MLAKGLISLALLCAVIPASANDFDAAAMGQSIKGVKVIPVNQAMPTWYSADNSQSSYAQLTDSCLCIPGDCNNDGEITVADAVCMICILFAGCDATGPDAWCRNETNGDGSPNIGDAVYLINFIFKGGPPPIDCEYYVGG